MEEKQNIKSADFGKCFTAIFQVGTLTKSEVLAKKYKVSWYRIADNIPIFSVPEHCWHDTAEAFATVILDPQSFELTVNKYTLFNQEFRAFTLLKQMSHVLLY